MSSPSESYEAFKTATGLSGTEIALYGLASAAFVVAAVFSPIVGLAILTGAVTSLGVTWGLAALGKNKLTLKAALCAAVWGGIAGLFGVGGFKAAATLGGGAATAAFGGLSVGSQVDRFMIRSVKDDNLGVRVGRDDGGVVVQKVFPGSVADRIGLKPGDVITRESGVPTPDGEALAARSAVTLGPGPHGPLEVDVTRQGLNLALGDDPRPARAATVASPAPSYQPVASPAEPLPPPASKGIVRAIEPRSP